MSDQQTSTLSLRLVYSLRWCQELSLQAGVEILRSRSARSSGVLAMFMLCNILLLAFVALAFDPRETYRHRIYTDPLSLCSW